MKDKRDCKIVQDLLPNYIENLTNEETNKFIDEHLQECNECNEVLENMQKDYEVNINRRDEREVKYIKKFRNNKRILIIILIIIFAVSIVSLGRKMIIISSLSNKAEVYTNSNNYHSIICSYGKGEYSKAETYVLNDKMKMIISKTNLDNNETLVIEAFTTKQTNGTSKQVSYKKTEDGKFIKISENEALPYSSHNALYTDNCFQLLIYSIFSSVKLTTFDGNECYYISNFEGMYTTSPEGMYINKDTGLVVGTIAREIEYYDGTKERCPATERVYEFDTATEKDFIEPNINE